MEALELINKGMHEVRRDSNLMHLYIELFQKAFKFKPVCAGCSFSTDWFKFVSFYNPKSVTLQKEKVMSKTISIKKVSHKILSYKKDGRTYRLYDNNLNDDFIKNYLENGTEEELKERKKMFNFPSEENKKLTVDELVNGLAECITNGVPISEEEKNIIKPKGKRGRKPKQD